MIHFDWPWMALLLPLPWLHYRSRKSAEPRGAALFMPFATIVASATPETAGTNRGDGIVFTNARKIYMPTNIAEVIV